MERVGWVHALQMGTCQGSDPIRVLATALWKPISHIPTEPSEPELIYVQKFSNSMKSRLQPKLVTRLLGAMLLGMVAVLITQQAQAGPITNGVNNPPFTKLGVYGGVLTITHGSQALEIGNNGRDIGSTGDLYFRPGLLSQVNGMRVFKNGSLSDVLVTGRLCLFGTGTADCRSVWPVGGGSNYWQLSGSYLQPNTATYGVGIGDAGNPVTTMSALNIQSIAGGNALSLRALNTNLTGSAIRTVGGIDLSRTVVDGTIRINGQEVFHPGSGGFLPNEGRYCSEGGYACTYESECNSSPTDTCVGTGADADLLEGLDVTIKPGSVCKSSYQANGNALLCVCITSGATTRCTPMWNHI